MTDKDMFESFRSTLRNLVPRLFTEGESNRIGIYGPPNAGKSTLANQILEDWSDEEDAQFETSELQHETQQANRENVTIERNGASVNLDIVDTPGVTTQVDYEEFLGDMDEEEAKERSRGATEGVAEAMHWLREDIDGVVYVLDSTKDPFTQVNTMLTGIIEGQDLPVIILANKTDLDESDLDRIESAYPQHTIVAGSALKNKNMDELYDAIAEEFA